MHVDLRQCRTVCAALGALVLVSLTMTGAYASPINPPNEPLAYSNKPDPVVLNANDSGVGSLRAAIQLANTTPGLETIRFTIPGGGVHTIALASMLPVITDPVIIDATTQPSCNVPCIELSGQSGNAPHGFEIAVGGSTIKGFVINRFPAGIFMRDKGGNRIVGNFIGTDPSGTQARPNENGIVVYSAGQNVIGGTAGTSPGGSCTGSCNLISGNSGNGIKLQAKSVSNTLIQGNFIGTNRNGTGAIPNGGNGILVADSPNTTIGGDSPTAGNVISGNKIGIELGVVGASRTTIQGNYIGTNSAGTGAIANLVGVYVGQDSADNLFQGNVISGNAQAGVQVAPQAGNRQKFIGNRMGTTANGGGALGNGLVGIRISTSQNIIGGTAPGDGNVFANNGQQGVQVEQGTRNVFRLNSTFNNGFLGFNLGPGRVQPNDTGDADGGPNNYQNYPVIKKVIRKPAKLVIRASLNSTPNSTFAIDYYLSPECDKRDAGEGKTPLGWKAVATDGAGNRSFSNRFQIIASKGQVVTMTATDSQGNTSEFSYCASVP